MPTSDITRTALSALIFFCFPVVKERPLERNHDLKLVNLVLCGFGLGFFFRLFVCFP